MTTREASLATCEAWQCDSYQHPQPEILVPESSRASIQKRKKHAIPTCNSGRLRSRKMHQTLLMNGWYRKLRRFTKYADLQTHDPYDVNTPDGPDSMPLKGKSTRRKMANQRKRSHP